jgi:hypothetical protein
MSHTADPRRRSYLIHGLNPLGADPKTIISRLEMESDVSARRAWILALGEVTEDRLPDEQRQSLIPKLVEIYESDPDAGIHGASEWVLRRWQQHDKLEEIMHKLSTGQVIGNRQWCVNKQGQSLVVIPPVAKFLMGSPVTETDRAGGATGQIESQHLRRIDRTFAIMTHEVTVEQFLRWQHSDDNNIKQYSPTEDCPINSVTWYEAAKYATG